jgi:hypothetical protein
MATQVDLTPAGGSPSLHVHVPAGQSAGAFNNLADFPNVTAKANPPAGGKSVQVTVAGNIRFSNPA